MQEGVIQADGTWPFQKWCHQSKKLITAHRKPAEMSRALKDLQFLTEFAGGEPSDPALSWGETTEISGTVDTPGQLERTGRMDSVGILGPVNAMVAGWGVDEDALANHEPARLKPWRICCTHATGRVQARANRRRDDCNSQTSFATNHGCSGV